MLLTASSSSVLTCPIDSSPDNEATNEVCDISATFFGYCCTLLHLDVCRANSKDWKEVYSPWGRRQESEMELQLKKQKQKKKL